jgi:hypothetical protein
VGKTQRTHEDRRDERPPLRLIGPAIREPGEHRPTKRESEQDDPADDRLRGAPEHEERQDERQDQTGGHARRNDAADMAPAPSFAGTRDA